MEHLFDVQGMRCGHCEQAIRQAVLNLDPQAQIRIERDPGRVTIESNQARETLAQALVAEGYAVVR